MKKMILFFLCLCLLIANIASARNIEDVMLELYQDKNQDLSLAAMLVSVNILNYDKLLAYVKNNKTKNDPAWINTIKNYTITQLTFEADNDVIFIVEFPEDKEQFNKLIDFETKITRYPPSKVLGYLIDLAGEAGRNPRIKSLAKEKLENIKKVADGWVADILDY